MITALTYYIDIRKMLYLYPTGLLWALGSGYCNAWRLLHQAEEAMIVFDSKEEVIYGAMGDKMALQGSAIGARDELIESLIQGVIALQPPAGIYLRERQPNQQDNTSPSDEPTARSVLRRVRRALNSLRD